MKRQKCYWKQRKYFIYEMAEILLKAEEIFCLWNGRNTFESRGNILSTRPENCLTLVPFHIVNPGKILRYWIPKILTTIISAEKQLHSGEKFETKCNRFLFCSSSQFYRNTFQIVQKYFRNFTEILLKFYRNTFEILQKYFWNKV